MLNEALNYFYSKTNENREIHVSCFEVFLNNIYDLLMPDAHSDKECNISSHFAETIDIAVKLLENGLQKRKV
jgi:hypothetical protein